MSFFVFLTVCLHKHMLSFLSSSISPSITHCCFYCLSGLPALLPFSVFEPLRKAEKRKRKVFCVPLLCFGATFTAVLRPSMSDDTTSRLGPKHQHKYLLWEDKDQSYVKIQLKTNKIPHKALWLDRVWLLSVLKPKLSVDNMSHCLCKSMISRLRGVYYTNPDCFPLLSDL